MDEKESILANVSEEIANQTKSIWHFDEISNYLTFPNIVKFFVVIISIVIFVCLYKLIQKIINKKLTPKISETNLNITNKIIKYTFYVIIAMYILSLFGIDLKGIWGAAGIVGIAIGFAAQTTVSNFISGIFVVTEKSIKINDYIVLNDVEGTVTSVGLLSVKLRTMDNQMIRIPNSTIMNGNLINYSAYQKRRILVELPIPYDEDLDKVLEVMKTLPSRCPLILDFPEPLIYFDGFKNGIVLKIGLWFKSSDLFRVRTQVYKNIVQLCNENQIHIPYEQIEVKNSEK